MIYQQDWLMRQIEAMIAAIAEFFFQKKEETVVLPLDAAEQTEIELKAKLYDWLDAGLICKAEDWLYENMDDSDMMWFRLAVYFYSEANRRTDAFLEEHNFSREEVMSGLSDVCHRFGYEQLLGL